MAQPTPIWSALSEGVSVRRLDHGPITARGDLLVARIRHHMATPEPGDEWSTGPTWGMVNDLQSSTEPLITWALFQAMAVVDRSAIPDPHQVTMIARGFGDPARGSELSAREQRRHFDTIDQTANVDNGDGRVWILDHAIDFANEMVERVHP